MSKWGIEEQETLEAIKKIKFNGKILNLAAGDRRFNNELLKYADKIIAIDKDTKDLKTLESLCPESLKEKLEIKTMDITKLDFENNTFDGIFCTGTLHLFPTDTIIKIIKEIKRVLKPSGKIILDFATEITRYDKFGNKVSFEEEGNFRNEEAIKLWKENLKEFDINIEIEKFKEDNCDESTGYQYIIGNFLLIKGTKNRW